jgi:hypothetical protein
LRAETNERQTWDQSNFFLPMMSMAEAADCGVQNFWRRPRGNSSFRPKSDELENFTEHFSKNCPPWKTIHCWTRAIEANVSRHFVFAQQLVELTYNPVSADRHITARWRRATQGPGAAFAQVKGVKWLSERIFSNKAISQRS